MKMARMKIIIFIFLFIFIQRAAAEESSDKITRIAIASSDEVKYEAKWLDTPPRLIIKFNVSSVFGQLVNDSEINQGVVKRITVDYYPSIAGNNTGSKQIKFLTFWLSEKAPYRIWNSNGKILIDFRNPVSDPVSKEIEISSILNVKDSRAQNDAIETLLARFENTPNFSAPLSRRPSGANSQSMAWAIAVSLIAIYIIKFRPEAWKSFMGMLVNAPAVSFSWQEKRKWWRHNLLPLKDKNIYIKVKSHEANTELGLSPRDIGYGGLSFEYNRLKNLKGKLDISIFLPGGIDPVNVEGNISWQKTPLNIFKRRIGVSFTNPPNKDWARINHYIEEQYAMLTS